jgi:hypothetical protein
VLLWDVTGRAPSKPAAAALAPADVEELWSDLADLDAARAHRAMGKFLAAPADAVPLVQKRVPPVPGKAADAEALAQLIAELDRDSFDVREKAARELQQAGKAALPALRKARENPPSQEVRRRVEQLLEKLESPNLSGEQLRSLRAVELLERVGSPEARRVLEGLTRGNPDAPLTQEARASLERLKGQPASAP